MVHNAIEYGMLEAYGEGFELLNSSEFDISLKKVSKLWDKNSIIKSFMLEIANKAFEDKDFENIEGYVEDSQEGRWTVNYAIENAIPLPVLTLALMRRFASRQNKSFSLKFIAAMRYVFGGHKYRKKI